ncbi:MAG: redoxin domain-containing protein [Candidatus Thorarchaeota archaeon]|nr:MAG: redoxin domain-containing protein [Candidatus Thorarchaeota archaeon]
MTPDESAPPDVGDLAPDFALPSTQGETVQLLSLRECPVILFFLTDTFTFFSRGFSKIFEALHESLSMMEVRVVGVSTEPVETLCTFSDDQHIPYTLLSDFDRHVSRAYGTLTDRIAGLTMVTRAGIFVIDTKGRIAYRWIYDEEGPVPDADQIVELVSKLQSETSS